MENPLSQAIPPSAPGNFLTSVGSDGVIDIDTLKAKQNLGTMVLIDSREAARYRGEVEPIDPIAGHIPGAINSPWQLVSNSEGYLQPISSQRQLWQAYEPRQEIVVYCGSGVTACVNIFSLFLTGYHNVKLYPGGWSDWCSYLC
jgi:thiosulfate/3-mercaptopyruvate sulfurtransferase